MEKIEKNDARHNVTLKAKELLNQWAKEKNIESLKRI